MNQPEPSDRLPFARPMKVGRLRRDAETAFRIAAEPEECVALARFLDVGAVERLSLAGFVSPHGRDGWRVRGQLVAKVVQSCVVTLEPVRSRIDTEVERIYVPASELPSHHEVVLLPDEEDAPDPFTDSIDPAKLAIDSLVLLIDPYPRLEDGKLETDLPADDAPETGDSETARPFADLAELMRRTGPQRG